MATHPLAGKPAPRSILIDVPRLVSTYYTLAPDPAVSSQRVAFGTSGHRGSSLSGAFNEAHILAVTQAICRYRQSKGIDGIDQRRNVPKKRTVWPGQHIDCGVCGRPFVYGGHGQTDHLICRGANDYLCWNGVTVDGPLDDFMKKAPRTTGGAPSSRLCAGSRRSPRRRGGRSPAPP